MGFFSLLPSLPASLPLSSVCRLPQAILRDSTDNRGGGMTRKEGRCEVLESTGMNGRWQSGLCDLGESTPKYVVSGDHTERAESQIMIGAPRGWAVSETYFSLTKRRILIESQRSSGASGPKIGSIR